MLHYRGLCLSPCLLLGLAALQVGLIPPAATAQPVYVDRNATGPTHDGSSWCNAFLELDAAAFAAAVDVVYVADGVYRPDTTGLADPRDASFQLKDNVAVLGGFADNSVTSGAVGATIGGGGSNGADSVCSSVQFPNTITDSFGTIGGGAANVVGNDDGDFCAQRYAIVSGGSANGATRLGSTVGGGQRNTAWGDNSTVGGGYFNSASGESSTVGGGQNCTASAYSSTVGGGSGCGATRAEDAVFHRLANAQLWRLGRHWIRRRVARAVFDQLRVAASRDERL